MKTLETLTLTSVQRPTNQPALISRRHKLIERIHQQMLAAEARQQGRRATKTIRQKYKNKETGAIVERDAERTIREQFWFDNGGKVFVELRYGARNIEFAKGKTAIEVGDLNNLIPTLEKLKQATEQGELDEQLAIAATRPQQFAAKKAVKK